MPKRMAPNMKHLAPQISVLLPVYNGGPYLKEAIRSILNQTFKNFEFIIINDGSTDNSKMIMEAYAATDKRIRIFNQKNQGLVATLNRGLKLAKYNLIARMDADDIAVPTRLEKQVSFMQKNPNIVVLGSWMKLINHNGVKLRTISYPTTAENLKDRLLQECLMAHPSVCMRKDIILELGGYRQLYKHAEDYDLWLRVFERDNDSIENLKDILLLYRQHDAKISLKYQDQQQLASITARLAYKFRKENNYDPTDNLNHLELQTLNLFKLPRKELDEAMILVMNAKLSMISNINPTDRRTIDDIFKQTQKIQGASRKTLTKFFLCTARAYFYHKHYSRSLSSLLRALATDPVTITNIITKKVICSTKDIIMRIAQIASIR